MSEEIPARPDHSVTLRFLPVLLVLVTLGAVAYSIHEHSRANKLASDNHATSASLNATRDQLNALSAKVNALEAQPAPARETRPAAVTYRKPLTAAVAHRRMRRLDDSRWKKMQGQLDEQGQQIESTRQELASARTELQGSIAKTHDDLVLLQKKGERNYFEFDLAKADSFERQGPISIRLRKANTKHEYADLELMVDDSKVSKKHVNVYEPVMFYPGEEKSPVEIVINNITKNHIHGYVSAPKYRNEDLQAMANTGASVADQASSDAKPSPVRQVLTVPSARGH